MGKEIREEIAKLLSKAAGVDEALALASLEMPKGTFGDMSSRIAFELAREQKKNPVELAREMAAKIPASRYVEKVVATGPYVNFFFSSKYFAEISEDAARDGKFGEGKKKKGKTIVEFPSVNPNKPWHIGHLRNALLGDSVARILAFSGEHVEAMDYIDDLGLQVAQSLYGYMNANAKPEGKFDHWIGGQYVHVAAEIEKNPDVDRKVRELLKKMEHGNNEVSEKGRWLSEEVVKAQYETDFALSIYHDVLVFESDILRVVFHEGMDRLKKSKAIHLEKEGKNAGCWVVQLGEKYKEMKDDQKILIRSDGTATYTGKDIIFQFWKFGLLSNDFTYADFIKQPNGKTAEKTVPEGRARDFGRASRVINIIGVEQSYPQAVIKDTFAALGYAKEAENLIHLAYEHAVLPEGKFSGRKGTWLGNTVDEFMDEAKKRAYEKIKKEMAEKEKVETADKVGIAAIKFSFLRTTPEKKIIFEWEKALSFEGDSGPYLQYAYVRTLGILNKWGGKTTELEARGEFNDDEKAVLRQVSIFKEIVGKAARDLRPHYIADYALELSTTFNKFYAKNQVIGAENEEAKDRRLLITAAAANVLKNALDLLGIEAPEQM
ncbi:Arginine--tRNA ligase [uncultured archaeon]|nr:Arginine--tRNA ligase [uncultured archaeon]